MSPRIKTSRLLDHDEIERDWKPLKVRIFGDSNRFCDPDDFGHHKGQVWPDGWIQAALPRGLCRAIGYAAYMPVTTFDQDYDEFATLLQTLADRGGAPLCIWSFWGGDKYVGLFPPERRALNGKAMDLLGFNSLPPYVVFDHSGEWGMYCLMDSVSILGGTENFMAQYFKNAGGFEAVRQRFFDYNLSFHDAFMCPDDQPIIDRLHDAIGWGQPDYPPDQWTDRFTPRIWTKPSRRRRWNQPPYMTAEDGKRQDDSSVRLSEVAYTQEWLPIKNAVFGHGPRYANLHSFANSWIPVGPKEWRQFPLPEALFTPWGYAAYWPVTTKDDPMVDEFATLLKTLQERGSDRLCIRSCFVTDDAVSVLVKPDRPSLNAAIATLPFDPKGHPYFVFDASGAWGLCCLMDGISVLTGDSAFMEQYLKNAGGLDAVRQRFYDYDLAELEWYSPFYQGYLDRFYENFGWTPPDYPEDQHERRYPKKK